VSGSAREQGLQRGQALKSMVGSPAVMGAGGSFRLDCSIFAATGTATTDGVLILTKAGDLDVPEPVRT